MTESDIFIVTNTYRNGRDNVISPFMCSTTATRH